MWHDVIPALVVIGFVAIALWHFHMAAFGTGTSGGAVPSVDGKPLFVPSTWSTVAVGLVLIAFAVLILGTAGWVPLGLPVSWLAWMCGALALGLAVRAVGDFRYVGFFKKV